MTISASKIVQVNPGVVGTGGNALQLNGVLLSKSLYVPVGTVLAFGDADTVSSYFGPASTEYAYSQIYFNGYENKTQVPGAFLVAPFVDVARAAFLRSASLKSLTLATLKTYTGTITLTINGTAVTSSSINLSAATSFSNAATIIQAAFTGTVPVVTWDAVISAFVFTSSTTGAASTITYASGTMAANLKLQQSDSATLSQGSDIQTPAQAMDAVVSATQNWVTFSTAWESLIAEKQLFAEWVNGQNKRYQYVCYDTDAQAVVNGSSTCFVAIAKAAGWDGVMPISGDAADAAAQGKTLLELVRNAAAFYQGTWASADFGRANGRITPAFKSQAGLLPTVKNNASAAALLANGYNFYGAYATANDQFVWFYNGQVPGKYQNAAPYINEIWLNNAIQLAAMTALGSYNSIPYNQQGYGYIRTALLDPIQQALTAGVIRTGVVLSNQQKAQINAAAGGDISTELFNQGYFLQVLDPGAQVRGQGGSPIINFFYTDGGDIRKLTIASIVIL